jgi:hypothetical protein
VKRAYLSINIKSPSGYKLAQAIGHFSEVAEALEFWNYIIFAAAGILTRPKKSLLCQSRYSVSNAFVLNQHQTS